jgi:hypothetical protein
LKSKKALKSTVLQHDITHLAQLYLLSLVIEGWQFTQSRNGISIDKKCAGAG